ncbi:MAG: ATP-binding protein [Acidimicrobiia bacterium]|nr:ATP-binding protein [Acidimicrobiia bacterium]
MGGAVLRPLGRLREDAARVTSTRDADDRVRDQQGLGEVDELARTLNEMLDRLGEAAAETEAALEALAARSRRTRPTSCARRSRACGRTSTSSSRTPTCPRPTAPRSSPTCSNRRCGSPRPSTPAASPRKRDLAGVLPDEEIAIDALVEEAVGAARHRHPGTTYRASVGGTGLVVRGWREGFGAGRQPARQRRPPRARPRRVLCSVDIDLVGDEAGITLVVEDDGPGIAPGNAVVLERFGRGASAAAGGSGLGLAVVAQQAQLHGGTVEIDAGASGGARFEVRLPRSTTVTDGG